MIDRAARDRFAEALRHLVSGQITNDEFEDRLLLRSNDPAVKAVFWNAAWLLYDDLKEYRLVGRYRLPRETRRATARWILFLKSDLPYEWTRGLWLFRFPGYVVNLVTLGIAGAIAARRVKRSGDFEVWPFKRRADYEAALRLPTCLAGPR